MEAERVVPVPLTVEGDREPSHAACPLCLTPCTDPAQAELFFCATCGDSVEPIQLADQPDAPISVSAAPTMQRHEFLTKRIQRVCATAEVTQESGRYVLTISNAVRVSLGHDWATAVAALDAWIREWRKS